MRDSPPLHGTALVAVDKLDKIGADGVKAEMQAARRRGDRPRRSSRTLFDVRTADARARRRKAMLVDVAIGGVAAFENLGDFAFAAQERAPAARVRFDPSLARGLSYYTGAIMEINVPTSPAASAAAAATTTWSACSSGRASRPAGSRSASSGFWS